MEKHIITYYEIINPIVSNNIAAGYNLGQRWFNSSTGVEYLHIMDGVWTESTIPNYDFLFVDFWGDQTTDIVDDGIYARYNDAVGPLFINNIIRRKSGVSIDLGNTYNIHPPISQTTIFIHPTTFERYLFDGTIMVVYNDIYEIVPKYLEYHALLTSSANTLVPKVLNQSDSNYIGDVTWTYDTSIYIGTNNKIKQGFTLLDKITNGNSRDDDFILGFYSGPSEVVINNYGLLFEGNIYSVKFKQRIPGAPPKLLSAETNIAGDKVILTFDKEILKWSMNFLLFDMDILLTVYRFSMDDTIIYDGKTVTLVIGTTNLIPYTPELYIDIPYVESQSPYTTMQSIDFCIFQGESSFTVTNNVPAPLGIVDAYTNEDGTRVIVEFNNILSTIDGNLDVGGYNYNNFVFLFPESINGKFLTLSIDTIFDGDTNEYLPRIIHKWETLYLFSDGNTYTDINGSVLEQFSNYPLDTRNILQ